VVYKPRTGQSKNVLSAIKNLGPARGGKERKKCDAARKIFLYLNVTSNLR
jgi:hypothetical protein